MTSDKFLVQNITLEDSEFEKLEGREPDEVAPILADLVRVPFVNCGRRGFRNHG